MNDMNEFILEYLFQNPSETFWMETPEVSAVAKVVSALANSSGGSLVIGAGDDGALTGVEEQEIEAVIKGINTYVKPFPPFSSSIVEKEGKKVLLINVWAGNNKPYVCFEAYYVRDADIVRKASLDEITCVTRLQEETNFGWERRYVPGVELTDLNEGDLSLVRRMLIDSGKVSIDANDTKVLGNLGLMSGGHVTNAGVVLFAKMPSVFLPQTRIRVSVYGGKEDTKLLDVRLYDVNLISAVDEIVGYVASLYKQSLTVDGMLRKDNYILPVVALREGVLNAVVHRLYDDYDSYVAINIYGSRLEIVNSGELYGNLKVEDLTKNHRSVLRNPDIANALYTMRYIEMAGSGTLRIIDECKRNGNARPQWKSENGCVTLTFSGVHHNAIVDSWNGSIDVEMLSSEKSVRKILEQILGYMQQHDKVKLQEIVELTGKSYASSKRYMRILSDASLIRYEGNLRTGGWTMNKEIE